jgi:ribosomal protein L12E/L44/L45/RPP1/RPP2
MQEEAEGRVCTGQIIIGAAHGQRTDTEKDKEEEEDNEEEEEKENRGIITQFFLISKILQH